MKVTLTPSLIKIKNPFINFETFWLPLLGASTNHATFSRPRQSVPKKKKILSKYSSSLFKFHLRLGIPEYLSDFVSVLPVEFSRKLILRWRLEGDYFIRVGLPDVHPWKEEKRKDWAKGENSGTVWSQQGTQPAPRSPTAISVLLCGLMNQRIPLYGGIHWSEAVMGFD